MLPWRAPCLITQATEQYGARCIYSRRIYILYIVHHDVISASFLFIKSKYCKQDWKATSTGKVEEDLAFCNACGSTVVDFSKATWHSDAHITEVLHLKAR